MTTHSEGSIIVDPFDPQEKGWTEDEAFYIDYVNRLSEKPRNAPFSNGRPFHAVYLIYKFFKRAQHDVRLFSGKLKRRVEPGKSDGGLPIYENEHVLGAVTDFLGKEGAHLKIVLEEGIDIDASQEPKDHPLVKRIADMKAKGLLRGCLDIRTLTDSGKQWLKDNDYEHHMLLMDKSAYRLEVEPQGAKAFVNMDDAKTTGAMVGFFEDNLYKEGVEICQIHHG